MSIILEKDYFLENVEQHTLYWFCSIRLPVFSWPLSLLLRQSSVPGLHITIIKCTNTDKYRHTRNVH